MSQACGPLSRDTESSQALGAPRKPARSVDSSHASRGTGKAPGVGAAFGTALPWTARVLWRGRGVGEGGRERSARVTQGTLHRLLSLLISGEEGGGTWTERQDVALKP